MFSAFEALSSEIHRLLYSLSATVTTAEEHFRKRAAVRLSRAAFPAGTWKVEAGSRLKQLRRRAWWRMRGIGQHEIGTRDAPPGATGDKDR